MTTAAAPAVYVGTFGKYNSGSIEGAWLKLGDFATPADFWDAAERLHSDEHDPELMFQDWQGIPAGMVSESWIDPELWQLMALEDWDAVSAFAQINLSFTAEELEAHLVGHHESLLDYADEVAEGYLENAPENLARYFDRHALARDLQAQGYANVNGYTFGP